MKILTIQAAYFPMIGGAEVFHQRTAEWLVKQGYQIDVVTCTWNKPDIAWKNWQKEHEVINGVNIYRVKPWFYRQYLKTFGAIWPLYCKSLQLIKENKYDLIHAHIFPASIVGALLKKKTGVPLVITVQGGDLADYLETGGNFNWILSPIIKWSLRKSNTVHTVSTHMKHIVKRMGVKNIKVIPNGVDATLFKPRNKDLLRKKFCLPKEKFIIISNSRLTYKNGIDLLIRSVSKLPDKKLWLILLVGDGEERKKLENLAGELNLKNQIKFLGYKDRETTAEFLSLADVFVRPSRQEGFGIAFLEAMASGLPVIGVKTGGIIEIVKNGAEGFLVSKENIYGLINVLDRIRDNVELRQKLGKNGRRKAIRKYSWNKIYPLIENLYQRIINR